MRFERNNISKRSRNVTKRYNRVQSNYWIENVTSAIGNFNKDFNMSPRIDNRNLQKLNKVNKRFTQSGKKHGMIK